MRRIPFIVLMLTLCCSIWATSVSKEQARRQAESFLQKNGMRGTLTQAPTNEARTRSALTGEELYYVFNVGQNQGYVIVSGDDRTESVLGYATSGTFDAAKIPENMAAWLDGYAEQIRYIQEKNIQPAPFRLIQKAKATVNELITTKWGQNEPFSNYCPTFVGKQAPTGCSATALAQVMKFWGYPKTFNGTVAAYTTKTNRISMNALPATSFDWANMIDDYSHGANAAQQEAVARLMIYVASALESDFQANTTGAVDNMYEKALSLFGYASSAKLMRRSGSISAEQWNNLIYHEISNGRPVVYNGQASNGGHAFVLHGYKNGYYAVNWGWNGFQDNYFLLDAMNPESGGTGHYSGGYNSNQTAVIGISPSYVDTYTITEDPILHCYDIGVGNPSSTQYSWQRNAQGNINFQFRFVIGSELAYTYSFNLGFVVIKSGETSGQVIQTGNTNFNFGPASSSAISGTRTFGSNLSDGEYYVLPTCKKTDESQWRVCRNPNNVGILMTVTSSQISMRVGYVKSDPDPDPDPDPQPDPDPDPDPEPQPGPGPEVTQQELAQLMATLDEVVAALNTHVYTLNRISKAINDNSDAITARTNELTAIDQAMTQINEALKKDATLTDAQKKPFAETLEALNDTYNEKVASLSDINDLIATAQKLAPELSAIGSKCQELQTTIPQITTRDAFTATQTELDMLNSQVWSYDDLQAGFDADEVASMINDLATNSFADLKTSVDDLAAKLSAAIKEAKDAKEKEEREKALAKAKEEFQAAVKKMADVVGAAKKHYDEETASLKTAEEKLKELASSIDYTKQTNDKAEELMKELEADASGVIAADIIAKYKEYISSAKENVAIIEGQIAGAKTAIEQTAAQTDNLAKMLSDATKLSEDLQAKAKSATDADQVTTLTQQLLQEAALLEENSTSLTNTIAKDLSTLTNTVNTTVENVGAARSDIDSVKQLIDTAIETVRKQKEKDEEEKQKAELLAKANEEFRAAGKTMADAIQSATKSYDENAAKLEELKKGLTTIEGSIASLKQQTAKLEEAVGELENKMQTRATTAEDVARYKELIAKANDDIAALESEYLLLKAQVAGIDTKVGEFAGKLKDASDLLTDLQAKVATLTEADAVKQLTAQLTEKSGLLKAYATALTVAHDISTAASNISALQKNATTIGSTVSELAQAIDNAITAVNTILQDEMQVESRHDMKGNPVEATYRGVQIIRLKNGTTRKVVVK